MGDIEKAIELIYLKMDEFDYNNEYSYVYEKTYKRNFKI